MKITENHIIIMAGGVGSRFWPMSTSDYPKQFIDVLGVGKSLLQLAVERFLPICQVRHIWIVTNEKYVDIVREQLPTIPVENILAEPVSRNTAPCIGYACWKIQQKYTNANIVVSPSDALVVDTDEFRRVISEALNFTSRKKAIVMVGIKPNRPETGYGYICAEGSTDHSGIIKVDVFKEKPNLETAKTFLETGNYFWNAGIFVWNIQTITDALRTYTPNLVSVMEKMAVDFYTEKEHDTVRRLFPTCNNISIDYAVMEKVNDIYTIPAEFGWSDLGSWGALHQQLHRDGEGNTVIGKNVSLYNCKNCVIHMEDKTQIVLEGLDEYIVSERDGRLLVCRMSEEQHIKEFSASSF